MTPERDDGTAVKHIIEEALCHVALLLERLIFTTQNLGLLPRLSSSDDPLGGIVIRDSEVATIVAGFKAIGAATAERREGLLPDPFAERVSRSRCALRASLLDPRCATTGLARVARAFDLDDVALDMLLLALAPDWDLRIGRLFGFVNNDATQRRPTAGLLVMAGPLALATPDPRAWRALDALVANGLLCREASVQAPLTTQTVRGADALVELSMAAHIDDDVDADKPFAELRGPEPEMRAVREALLREIGRGVGRLVFVEGPRGSGRAALVRAAAREAGRGLEVCDLSALRNEPERVAAVSRSTLRARICKRVLAVRCDGVLHEVGRQLTALASAIAKACVPCFFLVHGGDLDAVDPSVPCLRLRPPRMGRGDLRSLWDEASKSSCLAVPATTLDDIAARYHCAPGRVWELCAELARRTGAKPRIEMADIRGVVRDLALQGLTSLAARHESNVTLDDLELVPDVRSRLDELVHRMRYRNQVFNTWSFADKAHESYGVSALFTGPAGTGKTVAAAAIANALEIDLFVVDISRIMSKWVGETEQNLARVFDEAEASSVALLFDEADSLFGKRSVEQRSASDRYANLTVNYLLQRMESYSGLVILTTNLESAMDDAFQRRITTKVRFPETDRRQREALWRRLLPAGAAFADDADVPALSRMFELQGAHIRRALTRAAFLAASSGRAHPVLDQADLAWAARCEHEDMGRVTEHVEPHLVRSPTRRTALY